MTNAAPRTLARLRAHHVMAVNLKGPLLSPLVPS